MGRNGTSGGRRARKHARGEGGSRRLDEGGEGAQQGGRGADGGVGADV